MIKYGIYDGEWACFTKSDAIRFAGFSDDGKFATYDINGAFKAAEDLYVRGHTHFVVREMENDEK